MKNYLKVFLLVLAGVLVFAPIGGGSDLIGAEKDWDGSGNIVPDNYQKLLGPLKDFVIIYKKEPKLTNENVSKLFSERIKRMVALEGKRIDLMGFKKIPSIKSQSKTNTIFNSGTGNIVSKIFATGDSDKNLLISLFVRDEVQKRWGNPPYDVIECNIDIVGNIHILNNYNVKVRSTSILKEKTIVSVEVASTEIEKIAELNQVLRITPISKKILNNNLAADAIRVSRIRIKSGNNYTKGYTGKGVVIGIIDSGIDWTHDDFVDPDSGKSRIRYIWDTRVTTPGKTPADVFGGALSGLSYGTVWTKAEIDGGSCTETDTNGHGTHVAGSATGNGFATGKYTGIAPNADIIAVKGLDNNGILFIYELADRLSMPCAINMSYGPGNPILYMTLFPNSFPADGTDSDSQKISGWNSTYGRGHIPVKAAGNEGHWESYRDLSNGNNPFLNGAYHADGRIAGGSESHTLTIPDYSTVWPYTYGGVPFASIRPVLRYGYWSNVPIRLTFTAPSGEVFGPFTQGANNNHFGVAGTMFSTMAAPAAQNGDYCGTLMLMAPAGRQPLVGNWTVTAQAIGGGPINYDLWCSELANNTYLVKVRSYFTGNFSHSNYIIDEGASQHEITVGSFATRSVWTSQNGGEYSYTKKPLIGHISSFSSPGPSRDRRIKPDIAAPGQIILSALSSMSVPMPAAVHIDPDGKHRQMSGTSMATPMTTGSVALILQKHPDTSLNRMKRILFDWALQDGSTREFGENAFGNGKLNVLPLNDDPVAVLTQNKTEVILDNGDYSVEFDGSDSYDPEDFPISYVWKIEDKPEGSSPELIVESEKATLNVDPVIEGMYRVSLAIHDSVWEGPKTHSQWIEAKFYPVLPPSDVKLERVKNDLIFVSEYVNKITWSANPENKVELANYRIYRKVKGSSDGTYSLKSKLDSSSIKFDDRGLGKNELYTYKITSISTNGKESDPVVISN